MIDIVLFPLTLDIIALSVLFTFVDVMSHRTLHGVLYPRATSSAVAQGLE